uniref:Mu-like prophage I protein n=1 Tax=Candidatus Kentrum sp. TC TaxID=2126339 RepID=A0A450YW45_9GAMM|nr:MAG: hypothetical protein BECKTC1821E_GA0114239_105423 [Candidatus Kentron sp. TC]
MSGEEIVFSREDIADMASAYDPGLHRAPYVKGHPANDDPAYGWAGSMYADERGLWAVPERMDPAFVNDVNAGRWARVSLSLYRPNDPTNPAPGVWYPRHIGMHGAQAVAVKGRDEAAFSDRGSVAISPGGVEAPSFAEETGASPGRTNQRKMRKGQVSDENEKLQLELERMKRERDQAEADRKKADAALEADRKKARDAELRARSEKNAKFAESLLGAGRIEPRHAPLIAALMNNMGGEGGDPAMFGEGEDEPPLEKGFREFLEGLPAVSFGEIATHGRAAERKGENPLLADAKRRKEAALERRRTS